MFDSEIDSIIQEDRKRIQKSLDKNNSPEYNRLVEILTPIIYAERVNHGNIYVDWLAQKLIETKRITVH